jgi:AcrR family transcriptional regulator
VATKRRADKITHSARVVTSAAARLTAALATLSHREVGHTGSRNATVAELCRLAGVSRNSLYRYHTAILKALRQYQRRCRPAVEAKARRAGKQLSAENAALREKISKLAALLDHHYAASREASILLERRERELAELRRALKLKPIGLQGRVAQRRS